MYDPLVTITHLAAVTDRIQLGTSALIAPLRNPFAVAKQAATLDALSVGRFILTVGVGWNLKRVQRASPRAEALDAHRRGHPRC